MSLALGVLKEWGELVRQREWEWWLPLAPSQRELQEDPLWQGPE